MMLCAEVNAAEVLAPETRTLLEISKSKQATNCK